MLNQFSRTQLLYGRDAMNYFASCRIAVFGIGGVGGYVVEALARSGIGAMNLKGYRLGSMNATLKKKTTEYNDSFR